MEYLIELVPWRVFPDSTTTRKAGGLNMSPVGEVAAIGRKGKSTLVVSSKILQSRPGGICLAGIVAFVTGSIAPGLKTTNNRAYGALNCNSERIPRS